MNWSQKLKGLIIYFTVFIIVAWLVLFLIINIRDSQNERREALRANALFGWLIKQHDDIKLNSKLMALNLHAPSFDAIKNYIVNEGNPASVAPLYLDYYKMIVYEFPNLAAAHALLGFCYYYTDKVDQAIAEFEAARRIKPDFFWFDYNLGLIYLKQGDYSRAANYFRMLLERPEEYLSTLQNLFHSKVYYQIFPAAESGYHAGNSLKKGYVLAHFYYGQCLIKLGREKEGKLFILKALSSGEIIARELGRLELKII